MPVTYTYTDATTATWVTWADSSTTVDASVNSTTTNVIVVNTDGDWETWTSANNPLMVDPELNGHLRPEDTQNREAAAEAEKRALTLLKENLDKEQLSQFDKTEWFFAISQSGKRYRIRHAWIANVDEVDPDNNLIARYCIHPDTDIPIPDSMLIQKLMLEADEERFLSIANKETFVIPRPLGT